MFKFFFLEPELWVVAEFYGTLSRCWGPDSGRYSYLQHGFERGVVWVRERVSGIISEVRYGPDSRLRVPANPEIIDPGVDRSLPVSN